MRFAWLNFLFEGKKSRCEALNPGPLRGQRVIEELGLKATQPMTSWVKDEIKLQWNEEAKKKNVWFILLLKKVIQINL